MTLRSSGPHRGQELLTSEANSGTGTGALIDIPWLLLAGVAVAVPLLAVAVTGLAVRAKLPMVSRVA